MSRIIQTALQFPATITITGEVLVACYDDEEEVLDFCTVVLRDEEQVTTTGADGQPWTITIPYEEEIASDLWWALRNELAAWVVEATGVPLDALKDNLSCPEPYLEGTIEEMPLAEDFLAAEG